jgi:YgiT-type zinc finger domain-containing protein
MGKRLQNQKKEKVKVIVDRCDLCGGQLKPGQTTLEIWRGAEMLVIKDVPADVCEQCHEAYISADVSERLDYFLREYHQRRPERYLAVPQFSAVQIMEG